MKLKVRVCINGKLVEEKKVDLVKDTLIQYSSSIFGDGWIKIEEIGQDDYTVSCKDSLCLEGSGSINLLDPKKKHILPITKSSSLALPLFDMSFTITLKPIKNS